MTPVSAALALAQFAPSILRFFGVGEKPIAIAEQVVNIAQTVTGANSPQAALDALRQDPQLAQQFSLAVLAADTELEKAALADRQDARHRDVEIRKLTGGKNNRPDWMIVGDLVGLVVCMVVLIFFKKDIPGEVAGILNVIAAGLVLCLRDAHQFEFGSSRGSKEKDDLLGRIAGRGDK